MRGVNGNRHAYIRILLCILFYTSAYSLTCVALPPTSPDLDHPLLYTICLLPPGMGSKPPHVRKVLGGFTPLALGGFTPPPGP